MRKGVASLLFAAVVSPCGAAVSFPRPVEGVVTEECDHRLCEYMVWVTDARGGIIPAFGFPMRKFAALGEEAVFNIPERVQTGPNPGNDEAVFDVFQRTRIVADSGEENSLAIESVLFDPDTSTFALANIFGTLAERVGVGTKVRVPDLFADVNGDGVLGDGDVLHSLVDLTVFLAAVPTFQPGEVFEIIDGVAATLPGMMFSTSEFSFSETTGFTGTPYSGPASVEAFHGLTAIAEPPAAGLLATALVLLGFARYRRPRDFNAVET